MSDQFETNPSINPYPQDSAGVQLISEQNRLSREELILMQQQRKFQKCAVDGARWFYWIAGLSIVNSIISLFNGDMVFMFGLGISQLIDAIAFYGAEEVGSETGLIIKIVGFIVSLVIAGICFLIGYFGSIGKKWVLLAGIVLYGIDLLFCLIAGAYLDVLFHLFVLFFLIRGVSAINNLQKLNSQPPSGDRIVPLHSA
ncbi:MAG: hypothetical protein JEZ00_20465 [Anaerolineaceae bacterium]|nr:hypothetical protein [Anaerolineaceae bacterium]